MWSWCSHPWKYRPDDHVRDARGGLRVLEEGLKSKGTLTLGFYDLLVSTQPGLPSTGIQSSVLIF